MNKFTAVLCVLLACVAGCSMQPMSPDLMNRNDVLVGAEIPEGSARIVFLRMSSVSSVDMTALYEISQKEQAEEPSADTAQADAEESIWLKPEFIAMMPNQSKFTLDLPAGMHRFMTIAQDKKLYGAEFMQAELEAGKTYYAVIKPEPGYGKTAFRLHPVHASPVAEYQINSDAVRYMIDSARAIENTDESQAWADRYDDDVLDLYERTRDQWGKLSKQQKSYFTLDSSDGM